MIGQSSSTRVVSNDGNIVTYKEHCEKLTEYFEQIKENAMQLTATNRSLCSFIQTLQLVYSDILIEGETCKHSIGIEGPTLKRTDPLPASISKTTDEHGHFDLSYDFLHLYNLLRENLVEYYILPNLFEKRHFVQSYVKEILINDMKWICAFEKDHGNHVEMQFTVWEPDTTFFLGRKSIVVLIGRYSDIEADLDDVAMSLPSDYRVFVIDLDDPNSKRLEDYTRLLENLPEERIYLWNRNSFYGLFYLRLKHMHMEISKIMQIGEQEAYLLAALLCTDIDYGDDVADELIKDLVELPRSIGKSYEELIKRILTFCFHSEFEPFYLQEQVPSHNKKRIRDFVIDNRGSQNEFWKHLKSKGVEKILIDAKNYRDKIEYAAISSTLRYLRNSAFGNFIIIISPNGIKDYEEVIEDYGDEGRITVFLNNDDLVAMIQAKKQGGKPTKVIEDIYYKFLNEK